MNRYHFIEPLDVLFLRGNKLFGDPGSYGESQIPPWPSAAAGALRSMLLSRDGVDLEKFRSGGEPHPVLGTPSDPGDFRVTTFGLARHSNGGVETVHAIPADLVISKNDINEIHIRQLAPHLPRFGIQCSFPLTQIPVLAEDQRGKPASGFWLGEAAWRDYLNGIPPKPDQLLETGQLWQLDERIGVGLDPAMRRAEDGKLFSSQAIAFREGVGFIVGVAGAELPEHDMLRLGGDGRAASLKQTDFQPPDMDYEAICKAGRCRIVLTSPGLFADGWRLPGMAEDGVFDLAGVRGRMAAAAVSRAEVVSGWDLANNCPKPALRAAPTGSVYWLDELDATTESLRKLADRGLWPEEGYDAQRKAEGFNRFAFAAWR